MTVSLPPSITPMRERRDIPEPEHTNTYAGAVYVESLFDDLVMNMNDQSYVHEGDRLVWDNQECSFVVFCLGEEIR